MQNYDVVIIGAGSGGASAAMYAAKNGLRVALIEEDKWGGTTIHCGSIHARMLQKHAKIVYEVKKASEWGFEISVFDLDYERLRNRMQSTAIAQTNKLYTMLQEVGVTCIQGTATIDEQLIVHVESEGFQATNLIIATGSQPLIPEILGLESVDYLTTNTIYELEELPKKLTIIGGGLTAVETAFSLAPLGTEVTIIEKNEDILIDEDPEIRYQLKKQLAQLDVMMQVNQQITEVTPEHIMIEDLLISHDQVFIACGRQARTEIADFLALKKQQEGTIFVNEFFQTSQPKIYAIGQVCNSRQFSKTAYSNGIVAVNHILQKPAKETNDVLVRSLNTIPDVASFGLTEEQAIQAYGDNVTSIKLPIHYAVDGLIEDYTKCILKLIVHKEFDEIIGAMAIGEYALQVIEQIAMIVRLEGSLEEALAYIDVELGNYMQQRKIV